VPISGPPIGSQYRVVAVSPGIDPEVDVVILTWNDGPLLDTAIASALGSQGVDVRVVVVDNGSQPPAEVPPDPRVTLLRNDRNRGVAGGRNQGIGAGSAPMVLLLDSDARLHPGSLAALLGPLRAEARVGLAVPVFTGQAPEASAGAAPTLRTKVARVLNLRDSYAAVRPGGDEPWWDVDFGIGACQLFRRAAYDEVGGIDESFFYGPEDVDFCLRLLRQGWRVVQVAEAPVDHPPRRSHRQMLSRRGMRHAWAVTRFLWRYRGGVRRP
jgi:GT2 family glycosyltransferase